MTTPWALVLGGGGLAGIAWETGVLHAFAEQGLDVATAGYVLGTSAGATVAGQLASGLPVADLYGRQVDPARQNAELAPEVPIEELTALWASLAEVPGAEESGAEESGAEESGAEESGAGVPGAGPEGNARRLGAAALAAATVPEAARREVIAARLPVHEWPSWELAITGVDAQTGRLRVFDRDSGVALVDAVAASCAVPCIWPPVTIGADRYIDGGVRSTANADLAAGYERVLILAPLPDPTVEEQAAALRARADVHLIVPDEAATAVFGLNPLDPAIRTPCAEAGYRQGLGIKPPVW
jgi:NTE family protein